MWRAALADLGPLVPAEAQAAPGAEPRGGWEGEEGVLAYADLVKDARRLPLPDPKTVPLKNPKDFTLLGRSIPHLDIPDKVKGVARFGLDVRVPGMVYAVVAQCPYFRGDLLRFISAPARIAASCARLTWPWISASPTIIDSRPAVTRYSWRAASQLRGE